MEDLYPVPEMDNMIRADCYDSMFCQANIAAALAHAEFICLNRHTVVYLTVSSGLRITLSSV